MISIRNHSNLNHWFAIKCWFINAVTSCSRGIHNFFFEIVFLLTLYSIVAIRFLKVKFLCKHWNVDDLICVNRVTYYFRNLFCKYIFLALFKKLLPKWLVRVFSLKELKVNRCFILFKYKIAKSTQLFDFFKEFVVRQLQNIS